MAGFGYLICTFRKRLFMESRITNEDVILEPLEPSPYFGVYDEIDENPLTFDTTDINVPSQESHYETIDMVSQESLSIATSSEHGDTGYLDPYFTIEEDENYQLQDKTSQAECSSFNSSNEDGVDQDNKAYNNLYQPLQENWQLDSHGYEVPVMVHKKFKISANEYVTNNASYNHDNVNNPLQKDRYMNNPTYENQKSQETKAGNDKTLVGDDSSYVLKIGNVHDYINMKAESNISMINCHTVESCKPTDRDKSAATEQKSFRSEIDLKDESTKANSNKIYLNKIYRDENDSNSNSYEDAKSCV
ncbi:Hypothetical predicted protein [Mytilus galloprovincialis]|uniref:Uncharacterized protein n=1 Tax=Mytilus galloprovincialis TaxID=29158 RepID=A0A8B6EVG1_MYTGA|nr:Hypothetical predicted protein [Mytilus galloprovincialis]